MLNSRLLNCRFIVTQHKDLIKKNIHRTIKISNYSKIRPFNTPPTRFGHVLKRVDFGKPKKKKLTNFNDEAHKREVIYIALMLVDRGRCRVIFDIQESVVLTRSTARYGKCSERTKGIQCTLTAWVPSWHYSMDCRLYNPQQKGQHFFKDNFLVIHVAHRRSNLYGDYNTDRNKDQSDLLVYETCAVGIGFIFSTCPSNPPKFSTHPFYSSFPTPTLHGLPHTSQPMLFNHNLACIKEKNPESFIYLFDNIRRKPFPFPFSIFCFVFVSELYILTQCLGSMSDRLILIYKPPDALAINRYRCLWLQDKKLEVMCNLTERRTHALKISFFFFVVSKMKHRPAKPNPTKEKKKHDAVTYTLTCILNLPHKQKQKMPIKIIRIVYKSIERRQLEDDARARKRRHGVDSKRPKKKKATETNRGGEINDYREGEH
ncbi:hypothetical protein VP01_62g4 [Puccinia sorghi]|uniref:Uncharacterized protein n=1 Tax=Puccinia sorghi TaxID=27349 RepID=A0A0L6UG86_9BASI|nr:hypothetical protein VP01_62g4 [Puccinia sorghi]